MEKGVAGRSWGATFTGKAMRECEACKSRGPVVGGGRSSSENKKWRRFDMGNRKRDGPRPKNRHRLGNGKTGGGKKTNRGMPKFFIRHGPLFPKRNATTRGAGRSEGKRGTVSNFLPEQGGLGKFTVVGNDKKKKWVDLMDLPPSKNTQTAHTKLISRNSVGLGETKGHPPIQEGYCCCRGSEEGKRAKSFPFYRGGTLTKKRGGGAAKMERGGGLIERSGLEG